MMKKLSSLFLVVAMVLSLSVPVSAKTYTAGDENPIINDEGSGKNALKVIYGSVDVNGGAMTGTNAVLEMETPVAFESDKHWAIEFKLSNLSKTQLILAEKGLESGSVNGIYLPTSGDLSIVQSSTWYFTENANKIPSDYNGSDEHTYRLENNGSAISYFLDGKNLGTYSKHSGSGVAGRDPAHGYTDGAPVLGGFTYGFVGMMRANDNAIWTFNSTLSDLSIYSDSSVIEFAGDGDGTLPATITTVTPEGKDERQLYPTDKVTLPAPSANPAGKVFVGWLDSENHLYKAGELYTVTSTGTTTLTASYAEAALTGTLMVVFDSDNTFSARLINANNVDSLSYQWMRDGADIKDATAATYTMTEADVGHQISCKATSALQSGALTSQSMTVTAAANGTVQGSNIVMKLNDPIATPTDKNWAIEFKLSNITKTQVILSEVSNENDAQSMSALYLYSNGDLAIIRNSTWYFTPEYTKPDGFNARAEHTYRIENNSGTVSYYLDGTKIGDFSKHPGSGNPSRTDSMADDKPNLNITYKYLGIERKYFEAYPHLINAYKFDGNLLALNAYENNSTVAFNANYEGAAEISSIDSFGTGAAQRQLYVGDKIILPAAPTREGYDFNGWSDGNTTYDAEAQYTVSATGTTTLTAQWTPTQYTITYDLGGGTVAGTNPTKYNITSSDIALTNPTKTGYTFKGWSGTGLTGDGNKSVTIPAGSTGGRSYTANWTANTYTVTFDKNAADATLGTASKNVTYGVTYSDLPTPVRAGFNFAGWFTAAAEGVKIESSTVCTTANDHTLYAHWTAKEIPALKITASPDSLLGGGTVTLTVVAPEDAGTITVKYKAASSKEMTTLTQNADGKYTVTLPNSTETYAFTVYCAENNKYAYNTATCTVSVTAYYVPGAPTYPATAPAAPNGTVTVSPANASKGANVTVTVKPSEGYELGSLTVKDASGNLLPLADLGNGKFGFVMPASKVSVEANFVKSAVSTGFADVPANAFFADAVKWAVDKGVTNGLTDTMFGPYEPCTRGQIITFLWRAAGSPEPKTAVSFTDVPAGSYYAKAVAWAIENGITNGMTETTFAPDATCTRGQGVTFLYRALKGSAGATSSFVDVPTNAFYADAVGWAVSGKVTDGTSNTTFSPDDNCTRGQIVTFLFRAYSK